MNEEKFRTMRNREERERKKNGKGEKERKMEKGRDRDAGYVVFDVVEKRSRFPFSFFSRLLFLPSHP